MGFMADNKDTRKLARHTHTQIDDQRDNCWQPSTTNDSVDSNRYYLVFMNEKTRERRQTDKRNNLWI